MSKITVTNVTQIKELKYLKSFRIDYKTKSGKDAIWELVSRDGLERLESEIFEGKRYTDGVMVFATNKEKTKVCMLKEFRVSVGGYVYMFPAGLSDEGESTEAAAIREFREETGMLLEVVNVSKARYVSLGIVNECVNVAYGYYSGTPSNEHQEDKEDAEIVFIDKTMAEHLLENEDVPIRTAQLLEHFFDLNPFFK